MTIEAQYGVPTVAVHTDKFDRVVRSVASVNGMPGLQQVFVPQPVMGKSARELRAYVDGNDPLTGRPVMQEVIEGLTRPFADEDLKPVEFDRSTPRLCAPDTEENLHRLFLENNWTDTLPIVLPTEQRVAARLAHTHRQHGERVHRLPLDRLHAGPPRKALARACPEHAPGNGPAHPADALAGPDHGAAVHRSRWVPHEGCAHRLALRQRAHARERVLGLPARPELPLPAGDVRRGTVGVEAHGRARRT